ELRARRFANEPLELLRVVRLHAAAIAIVPPVVDVMPRPLLNVEDVVADDREAALEADLDARDRRAHERDGDDADDDAERGQHGAHLVRADDGEGDAEGFREFVKHEVRSSKCEVRMKKWSSRLITSSFEPRTSNLILCLASRSPPSTHPSTAATQRCKNRRPPRLRASSRCESRCTSSPRSRSPLSACA